MGLIFKNESEMRSDPKSARRRAALLATPFALLGIFALVLFVHDGLLGGLNRQKGFSLLGAMAASIGFIALIFGISGKREAFKRVGAKAELDEKPWLGRQDWAIGRIHSMSKKAIVLLWIVVFFWCFGVAAISLVVPWQSSHLFLTVLVFVLFACLALVGFAAWTTRVWRPFARAVFQMPSVPAAASSALSGHIKVPGRLRPRHGWQVVLSCIRRKTSGPANNLRTNERVLWRAEQWLRPDLPQMDAGQTSIPVFFPLPADKPESTAAMGDGAHWRLEIWGRLPGRDFQVPFEVPVFKLPEQPAIPENIAAPYEVSLDEIRKEIPSKIQIVDLPEKQEAIFPGGRTPRFAAGAAFVWLIWAAMVGLLVSHHAPLPVLLIFGAMNLLMLFYVFDLWFRRSRAIVSAGTITIETSWPGYKKEISVKGADVAEFAVETGMMVGHVAYYDLKLRTRDGKEWILAKNLNHKPEAVWLARRLTAMAANTSAKDVNT